MFKNFTEEYKQALLSGENSAKKQGFSRLEIYDVVHEVLSRKSGNCFWVFNEFGINEKVFLDVMTHPKFQPLVNRTGEYSGISDELKDVIVSSVKTAASFEKVQVGLEDFFLSLLRQEHVWFVSFLDFIRISVRDFEAAFIQINTASGSSGNQSDNPLEAFGKMLGQMDPFMFPEGMQMDELDEEMMSGWAPAFGQSRGEKRDDTDTPALDFFCDDITEEAKDGKIDPIIGRDTEIDRLISILNRKTKNNPTLVGDPGVGKTAVVEGLARRIIQGNVPFAMQHKRILSLDMATLIAGTKYRGEFEVRIKQVIDEASKLDNEVILFIDELHTIIGAGSSEWALDAANILKPAMGRGKIRIIGATTLVEYQKYIEKDSALERRFQKIEVGEPSHEVATDIITGLRESFEEYHNLIIDDSAIAEAVDLSVRYITDRYLPDKAIDLIDEACSTKSMKYEHQEDEIEALKKKIEKIQKRIEDFVISQQYHKASKAKDEVIELEAQIRDKRKKITIPRSERYHIWWADIQRVIHQITGVPMKTLSTEALKKLKNLQKNMKSEILGQDEAVESIVNTIKRSQVGITSQSRPLGSFLFLGPTGVGKTELVKVLARQYYGDEKALIKIDMSEFSERSSSSKLIGTTAGYVGYEDGGVLTDQVRRKPYSIVLFDEIEKGNYEIFNLLLQIMEDGYVTDGKGRKINFRNTIIVMTSNLGSEQFQSNAVKIWFDTGTDEQAEVEEDFKNIQERVIKWLDDVFAPEFINRIDKMVVFRPLTSSVIKKIISLQLDDLQSRISKLGVEFSWSKKVVNRISKDTYNPEFGARPVRRYIQTHLEDAIAEEMLGKKRTSVVVDVDSKWAFIFDIK